MRSRVRPVDAAGTAAGPNALRGSGPNRKHAFEYALTSGFSRSPERPYLHYVVMPSPIGVADLCAGDCHAAIDDRLDAASSRAYDEMTSVDFEKATVTNAIYTVKKVRLDDVFWSKFEFLTPPKSKYLYQPKSERDQKPR